MTQALVGSANNARRNFRVGVRLSAFYGLLWLAAVLVMRYTQGVWMNAAVQICAVSDDAVAKQYLDSANGSLEDAINTYMAAVGDGSAPAAPAASAPATRRSVTRPRIAKAPPAITDPVMTSSASGSVTAASVSKAPPTVPTTKAAGIRTRLR